MTDIIQADRDAAALIFDHFAPNYAEMCRKGLTAVDGLIVVRTVAAHRLAQIAALEEPSPEMREAVARAIDAARGGNDTIYDYADAALAAAALHLKENG